MLIEMHEENPKKRDVETVCDILRKGGVIIYPTDTGYAFGCDLFNKKGIEKLIGIKRIDKRKTLSFVCANFSQMSEYAEYSNEAFRLIRQLLPGPYTFIMNALNSVSRIVSGDKKKVGIRIPLNNIDLAIVEVLGNPILSSSVNKYTELEDKEAVPLADPVEIDKIYGKQVDVIIDCGIIEPDFSTVIDISGDEIIIIRQGKGPVEGLIR